MPCIMRSFAESEISLPKASKYKSSRNSDNIRFRASRSYARNPRSSAGGHFRKRANQKIFSQSDNIRFRASTSHARNPRRPARACSPDEPTGRANARPLINSATSGSACTPATRLSSSSGAFARPVGSCGYGLSRRRAAASASMSCIDTSFA
jgi:hypothetical protein